MQDTKRAFKSMLFIYYLYFFKKIFNFSIIKNNYIVMQEVAIIIVIAIVMQKAAIVVVKKNIVKATISKMLTFYRRYKIQITSLNSKATSKLFNRIATCL